MAGSMKQVKPDVWVLRAYVGRDPVTGRGREKSRTFHGKERAAGRALADLVHEVNDTKVVPTAATMTDLLRRWIRHQERRGKSPLTINRYRTTSERHIIPILGPVELRKLRASHLDAYYDRKIDEGMMASSVSTHHAIISAALAQAVKWEWLSENVAARAEPPSGRSRQVKPPSVDDLSEILRVAAERDADRACLIFVEASIGARRGEMCGMRWQDINWSDESALIGGLDRAMIRVNGKTIASPSPKGRDKAARSVSLDGGCMLAFRLHYKGVRERLGYEPPSTYFVFSPDLGANPFNPTTVTSWFIRLRHDLGLDSIRLHDLRHFSVSHLLAQGIDPVTVAGRHGHSTTEMLKTYAHFLKAPDRVAAEVTGRLGLPQPRS